MMLLVSGATRDIVKYADTGRIGRLFEPRGRRANPCDLPWACDNSAYSEFNAVEYVKMLSRHYGEPGCLFVTAPDVVGDAPATLSLFEEWSPVLAGYPKALVLQDGQEALPVPWNDIDAVFVGGTTGFKVSDDAHRLCEQARDKGKWVHVGRVNTLRRIQHWRLADSIDGSGFSKWPKRIEMAMRWMRTAEKQSTLF